MSASTSPDLTQKSVMPSTVEGRVADFSIASAMRSPALTRRPRRERLRRRLGLREVLKRERRVEALAGQLPAELAQPPVEEEVPWQPGDRRRPPQPEAEELLPHARI